MARAADRGTRVLALCSCVAVVCAAACESGPTSIASLSDSHLDVDFVRSDAGYSLTLRLEYQGLGKKLYDECPEVRARATLAGQMIPQVASGGQMGCGWLDDCIDTGVCQPVIWRADFLSGLSFPGDGTVTIELVDAGGTTRAVAASAANLWADVAVSEVKAGGLLTTTLTLTPQGPFDTVVPAGMAVRDAHTMVLAGVSFGSDATGWRQGSVAPDGPNTFTVYLGVDVSVPHATAGFVATRLGYGQRLSACEGVAWCTFAGSAVLPLVPLAIP